MKKGMWVLIILLSFALFTENASAKTYKSETLQEACTKENITCENYEYHEDLPTIYIFRRTNCGYCKRLMQYISSLKESYENKINVVVYEAYTDRTNWNLAKMVAQKFNEEIGGFPYTVIGKKTIEGYSTKFNEEIEESIQTLISSKEKYDVVKEVTGKTSSEEEKKSSRGTVMTFIFGVFSVLAGILGYKTIHN